MNSKSGFIILIVLLKFQVCLGQKKEIDNSTEENWPAVENGQISNDGKYVSYNILYNNCNDKARCKLFIKSTVTNWELEIPNISNSVIFTKDSKYAIVPISDDSIRISRLGNDNKRFITKFRKFDTYGSSLLYIKNTPSKSLVIENLGTRKSIIVDSVSNYLLSPENDIIVFIREYEIGNQLVWHNLKNGKEKIIWEGRSSIGRMVMNKEGKQIAFIVKNSNGLQIYCYNVNDYQSKLLVDKNTLGLDSSYLIADIRGFIPNGKKLLFLIKDRRDEKNEIIRNDNLKILDYRDSRLQFSRTKVSGKSEFVVIISLTDGKIFKVENPNERLIYYNNNYAILEHKNGTGVFSEWPWNKSAMFFYKLKYFNDGSEEKLENIVFPAISPTGKFLLYYDTLKNDYFTYELDTKIRHNITQGVKADWRELNIDIGRPKVIEIHKNAWINNDETILLRDHFDIWQADPCGKACPINLTNGFGQQNNIKLFPIILTTERSFKKGASFIVPAFDQRNKDNGFFKITLGYSKEPQKIIMSPNVYYAPDSYIANGGEIPLKAKDANIWLITRMSASEFPNYYITKDFKNFIAVSSVNPERNYNWLSTELYNWITPEGNSLQGILYKPQDFKADKKYPLIIYYYERLSDNLNTFLTPGNCIGPINIPWFVSRGYLVFTPDIYYTIGHPGESAVNAVVSCAKSLSKESFINPERIGIQGHSYGGYETNYIVTHSKMFRAACTASGISDFISAYGSIAGDGGSLQYMYETHQLRIGATLWQAPELYLENSPVFNLDKVSTPLLIMHTTDDGITLLPQAIEMYTGLRRLGKKAWFLLYNKENHVLSNQNNIIDYTTRLTEFFDFYLKDSTEPKWMKDAADTILRE